MTEDEKTIARKLAIVIADSESRINYLRAEIKRLYAENEEKASLIDALKAEIDKLQGLSNKVEGE